MEDMWDCRQASFASRLFRSLFWNILEVPHQFWGVYRNAELRKMKRDPGVSMYRLVPNGSWPRTSASRATWARWRCSSAAPTHHSHLFIYPEATFSSVQQGEALRTSGSKHCPAPLLLFLEQCLKCSVWFFFFWYNNEIKIKHWLVEKWHEPKSLLLYTLHSIHSCPIHSSPHPPSPKLIYGFSSRFISFCLLSLVSLLWHTLLLFRSFSLLFYLMPLHMCCCCIGL